jgi:hypothetical protein
MKTALLLFWVISSSVWAITDKEFCESYSSLSAPKSIKKHSFKDTLTVLYTPARIIEVEKIESALAEEKEEVEILKDSAEEKKIIFIHFPQETFDKKDVKALHKLQKKISHLKLFKLLKKKPNEVKCLDLIKNNPEDFKEIENYLHTFEDNKELIERAKNQQMLRQLKVMLRPFQRLGWSLVYSSSLHSMYLYLSVRPEVQEIMMINHSDELGRLYDADKNIFPKGAFDNLPENIRKLMIFSCHPRKVISYYQIEAAAKNFDYYYPTVAENFIDIFEDRIPLIALGGFKKAAKNSLKYFKTNQNCMIQISKDSTSTDVVLALNSHFLGVLQTTQDNQVRFDCELLNDDKNLFKLFYLGASERTPFTVSQMVLVREGNESQILKLKTILSFDQQSHILTTGTNGGHL